MGGETLPYGEHMKFLIAGFGSIGRRHFRNLIALGEKDIVLLRSHRATLPDDELAGYPVETDLGEALKKHKPDTAAVEKLFFARNVTTGIAVGQARGVVLLALEKANIETREYSPNEVKQAVAGYGHAEKRQMQEMVRTLLQLEKIPKPDDAADALAIAITHLNTKRYE